MIRSRDIEICVVRVMVQAWVPKLVFCVEKCGCSVAERMSEAARAYGYPGKINGDFTLIAGYPRIPPLAVRLLRVNSTEDGMLEEWLRASGDPKVLETYVAMIKGIKGSKTSVSVIYKHKFSAVLRMLHEPWAECGSCPMRSMVKGAMPKTVVLLPGIRLLELIVVEENALEKLRRRGCKIVRMIDIGEMDYMLTPRQEQALMLAYIRGYHDFPRKTRLGDLAEELGLSISTLAELLHKAERKVIDAFIRHELPHYLAFKVLNRRTIPSETPRSVKRGKRLAGQKKPA